MLLARLDCLLPGIPIAVLPLCSLEITHGLTDQGSFTEGSEEAEELLDLARSELPALTFLNLSGVVQGSVPDSVGAMSALQVRCLGRLVCLLQRG